MSVGEYVCVGRVYVIINEANDKLTIEQTEQTKSILEKYTASNLQNNARARLSATLELEKVFPYGTQILIH
jgi:hypothetical protein